MKILKTAPMTGLPVPDRVLRIDYASRVDDHRDWFLVQVRENSPVWIVNLHGAGSHGDQVYMRQDIRDFFLPQFKKYGASIVSPNLRDDAWMCPAAVDDLHDILAYITATYGPSKFVFFAGSMGGSGALIYAVVHPEDVAGLVALGAVTDLAAFSAHWNAFRNKLNSIESAYGGSTAEKAPVFAKHSVIKNADRLTMPVYFTHGENDAAIPVEHARQLARKMQGRPDFKYREIPGGDHDSALWDTRALDWVMERVGR